MNLQRAADEYGLLENWVQVCKCYYFKAIVSDAAGDRKASRQESEQWMKYKAMTDPTN